MEKKIIEIHGKWNFLLGKGSSKGELYYLEAPSWDCGWYWGFGYIERYSPGWKSLISHEHAHEFYPKWVIEENARLKETVFEKEEAWLLAEFFKRFYLLNEYADFLERKSAGIAGRAKHEFTDELLINQRDHIIKVTIPEIMEEILLILSPEDKQEFVKEIITKEVREIK